MHTFIAWIKQPVTVLLHTQPPATLPSSSIPCPSLTTLLHLCADAPHTIHSNIEQEARRCMMEVEKEVRSRKADTPNLLLPLSLLLQKLSLYLSFYTSYHSHHLLQLDAIVYVLHQYRWEEEFKQEMLVHCNIGSYTCTVCTLSSALYLCLTPLHLSLCLSLQLSLSCIATK